MVTHTRVAPPVSGRPQDQLTERTEQLERCLPIEGLERLSVELLLGNRKSQIPFSEQSTSDVGFHQDIYFLVPIISLDALERRKHGGLRPFEYLEKVGRSINEEPGNLAQLILPGRSTRDSFDIL